MQHGTLSLTLNWSQPSSRCPRCGQLSKGIHSYYQRHLTDLPCSGLRVDITLQVRRFFCRNDDCPQRIFTERLPGIVVPYARRSERLNHVVSTLTGALGGRISSRLLRYLQVHTSLWSVL